MKYQKECRQHINYLTDIKLLTVIWLLINKRKTVVDGKYEIKSLITYILVVR